MLCGFTYSIKINRDIFIIAVGIDIVKDNYYYFVMNSDVKINYDVFMIVNNSEGLDVLFYKIKFTAKDLSKACCDSIS